MTWGFPGGSEVKASACNAGDLGSIPGSGRSPGEGNGNPLQYSCLENPMNKGAWWATVRELAKNLIPQQAQASLLFLEGHLSNIHQHIPGFMQCFRITHANDVLS